VVEQAEDAQPKPGPLGSCVLTALLPRGALCGAHERLQDHSAPPKPQQGHERHEAPAPDNEARDLAAVDCLPRRVIAEPEQAAGVGHGDRQAPGIGSDTHSQHRCRSTASGKLYGPRAERRFTAGRKQAPDSHALPQARTGLTNMRGVRSCCTRA